MQIISSRLTPGIRSLVSNVPAEKTGVSWPVVATSLVSLYLQTPVLGFRCDFLLELKMKGCTQIYEDTHAMSVCTYTSTFSIPLEHS